MVGAWEFGGCFGGRRGFDEDLRRTPELHCIALPQIQEKKRTAGWQEGVRRDVVLGAGFWGLGFVRLVCEGVVGKGIASSR